VLYEANQAEETTAVAVPGVPASVAVTWMARKRPMSAGATVYVVAVAPVMAVAPAPVAVVATRQA
jgi:hypothetical protein